jgi:hypothetical protein
VDASLVSEEHTLAIDYYPGHLPLSPLIKRMQTLRELGFRGMGPMLNSMHGPIPIKPAPKSFTRHRDCHDFLSKKISDTQWVPIVYPPRIMENKVKMPVGISNNATHNSTSLMFFKMAHVHMF